MLSRIPPLVLRLALLLAIGMSVALLIDYLRPLPAFCDIGSGCDQVRRSTYSHPLGIPLPVFGIAGFGAANYDRLARVKCEYDPDNVFHLNQNIEPGWR